MYKRVVELNSRNSRATGIIILVDKPIAKKKDNFAQFIKISDCHNSIYLHPLKNIHKSKKSKKRWIKKVEILKKEIDMYLERLKDE